MCLNDLVAGLVYRLSKCSKDLKDLLECARTPLLSTDNAYMSVQNMCDEHFMDECTTCKVIGKMPTKAQAGDVMKNCPSPMSESEL